MTAYSAFLWWIIQWKYFPKLFIYCFFKELKKKKSSLGRLLTSFFSKGDLLFLPIDWFLEFQNFKSQ